MERESANEPRHGIRYHSITHNDALNQCKRLVIQYTLKRNRYTKTKRKRKKKKHEHTLIPSSFGLLECSSLSVFLYVCLVNTPKNELKRTEHRNMYRLHASDRFKMLNGILTSIPIAKAKWNECKKMPPDENMFRMRKHEQAWKKIYPQCCFATGVVLVVAIASI